MAERYEDQYRRDRGYRRDDRGFLDRASDEVRSWFGDDDAERRRQLDDRDRYRERAYGQSGEYGPGNYRGSMDRDWRDSGGRGYYGDRGYAADRGYGNGSYYGDRASYWGDRAAFGDRESYGDYRERPGYPGSFSGRTGFESRARESFAGRGPRGYQRSDSRINEDVCDRLCDSPDIDASAIDVRVSGGDVTLSGSVASRDEKRRAEDLIEQVSGVREVHNNLRVGRADESFSPGTAAGSTAGTAAGETPGSTLGLTGEPDRASTAGRR
jgi:osmotically-inducible protein OsmY